MTAQLGRPEPSTGSAPSPDPTGPPAAADVTAVVLAYGAEPVLREAVCAILASTGVNVTVVVVDNGCDATALAGVRTLPGVLVVNDGTNLGFAGGCNFGASHAHTRYLAFVNSDAIVAPNCLAELVAVAADPAVGLVSGSIRLAEDPDRINSAGNPVHFLFFSWAGGLGDPAASHDQLTPVASISGATFAARTDFWAELGGFDSAYFLYGEDVDISLRTWQLGYMVMFAPGAVSVHHYQFSRNPEKFYYLERNRLISLATLPERGTLARLAPTIAGVELALLAAAAKGGWLPQKLRSYRWLARNRRYVRTRRRDAQSRRRVPDSAIAGRLSARMDIPGGFGMSAPPAADRALARYWLAVSKNR
jgi:GT2 family glycosyltransferase